MEMHELDKRIKRALLSKTNEILPSEDTFTQILASLEKKKARRSFNIRYKHYIIAFICAVSVIFGTIMPSVDVKNSATEMLNTVTTLIILDNSNKVVARNTNELFKYIDNTQLAKADNSKILGASVLFLRTFTKCFLLNKVNNLELYLRILILGRMTNIQTWYDKFRYRQVPLY